MWHLLSETCADITKDYFFIKKTDSLAYPIISHTVVANQMDRYIVEIEFEFQSRYYVHFRTNTLGGGVLVV